MDYLSKMYGNRSSAQTQSSSNKNPNRVAGGIKGQGADHIVMVSEDGAQQQIPTQKYVQSLEEQIRKQRAAITVLERKLTRSDTAIEQLKNFIK